MQSTGLDEYTNKCAYTLEYNTFIVRSAFIKRMHHLASLDEIEKERKYSGYKSNYIRVERKALTMQRLSIGMYKSNYIRVESLLR